MTTASTKSVWGIDPAHSEITFKVKHLVIATVTGKFDKYEGSVESTNDDFSDAKITFTADVNSINTSNEQRDGHLKSDDFFNAEHFPKLTFVSTSFKKISDHEYKLAGDITIRNITKNIELTAEYAGVMVDPYGNTKAGFEINGKISRKEFGLKWDAITEAGGAVVSDEVKLHLNIELHKQAN
jgi:polyisoprenoid-binding protein YceI